MNLSDYNPWAILVAAAVAVAIGVAWYAQPVFGKRWQGHVGVSQPTAQAFAIWVVCYVVIAVTMVYVFNRMGVAGAGLGLRWGITFGVALVALAMAPNYAFGRKPLSLFLIEAGYVVVAFAVMGVILAAWH